MSTCGKFELGSFSSVMERSQTKINASQLARLQGLSAATRAQLGTSVKDLRIPARLIVDFDPWALSLDITATAISQGSLHALIDLSKLPTDTCRLLSPGDLYRIQFQTKGTSPFVLPLLTARLDHIDDSNLRFKWLLNSVTEREFQKFLHQIAELTGHAGAHQS